MCFVLHACGEGGYSLGEDDLCKDQQPDLFSTPFYLREFLWGGHSIPLLVGLIPSWLQML